MHKMSNVSTVLGRMYKSWYYVALTFVIGFLFVLLNGFVLNFRNIREFSYLGFGNYLQFVGVVSLGFWSQVYWLAYAGTILLGVLIGMFVSLLVYRFSNFEKEKVKGVGIVAGIGIFLGAAAPGCGACGIGLLSLFGLTPFLTLLPFHGNEVLVLALGFTIYGVYSISGKLYNPSCEVNLMSSNSNIANNEKSGKSSYSNSFTNVRKVERNRKRSMSVPFTNVQETERRSKK